MELGFGFYRNVDFILQRTLQHNNSNSYVVLENLPINLWPHTLEANPSIIHHLHKQLAHTWTRYSCAHTHSHTYTPTYERLLANAILDDVIPTHRKLT